MSRLYFHVLDKQKLSQDTKKDWKKIIREKMRLYPVENLKRIPINGNANSEFAIYTEMKNPDIDLLPKLFGKFIKENTNYLWGILSNPQKRSECMMYMVDIDKIMTVAEEKVIYPTERRRHVFLTQF